MLSINTLKTLYKLSFSSKDGHNLRQACLRAMGKIKVGYDTLLENEFKVLEALENAPKDVQAAVKEEAILASSEKVLNLVEKNVGRNKLDVIKKYFQEKNIGIKEFVHGVKSTDPSLGRRFHEEAHAKMLELSSFNEFFTYLYRIITAKTPEELAAVNDLTREEFYKTLGVTPEGFAKVLITFGGVAAFMDEKTALLVEKWITVAKVVIPGWLQSLGLGAIMLNLGLWFVGAWIMGLIFGIDRLTNFVRKVVMSFTNLPLVLVTQLVKIMRLTYGFVINIASQIWGSVKKFFSSFFRREAKLNVLKQASLLAKKDTTFKRALLLTLSRNH